MAELRRDAVSGRWVIIATERSARPQNFYLSRGPRHEGFCPFCEGNEDRTPPEVAAVRPTGTAPNTPGWKVRVVPNKYPALRVNVPPTSGGGGVRQTMSGFGAHEVIIESPHHLVSPTEMTEEDLALVLQTYCERMRACLADERLTYVLIFKNVGDPAGATIEHTHSQLIAVPVMPKRVHEEMERCTESYGATGRCLFCEIVEQEMQSGERVVADTGDFLVLCPFAGRFPFEMWLLPKFHAPHLHELAPDRTLRFAQALHEALARLEVCLNDPPYNYVIHTAPMRGENSCHYHWHVELIPRVTEIAGFEWGTGFYINPMEPERAAEHLRAVTPEQVTEKISSDYVP